MNQLNAELLVKAYKHKTIVNGVSLTLKPGECVGLLGPNGAGKTTFFYLIVGLIAVDSGRISIDNIDVTHKPIHERAKLGLGYLPQEASVFRKLSVTDNILSILELRQDLSPSEQKQQLYHLLEEFNLTHIQETLGMRLSGGERRRVEIARALAINPRYILLDEPFAGVDPISVIDIKSMITHLCKRGIGVLITDHNVRETLQICERATIVNQGQVLCEGSPEEILSNQKVRDIYLGEEFQI